MVNGARPAGITAPTRELLLTPDGELWPEQRAYLYQSGWSCPDERIAPGLIVEFMRLVQALDHPALVPWLAAADASGLPERVEFAKGIGRLWK